MCPTDNNCGSSKSTTSDAASEAIINLDHGDPTMFESYWENFGENNKTTIYIHQSLSYFANANNQCWFMEPKLEEQIKILHKIVGNAVIEDRYIVVGAGSSQLTQAALYALCTPLNEADPIDVVSATPYYSAYPEITDYVRSRLFNWAGDAHNYYKDGPYVEIVTSPSNPDGSIREPVVNRAKGMLIHDYAYYWPQYTPITSPADQDLMLFTVSKSTGHAGSRIGWALVRDKDVAKRMIKFIEVNTIGVSKEAQIRAATIIEAMSNSCKGIGPLKMDNFFGFNGLVMAQRWRRLRDIVKKNGLFHVPSFAPQYCTFKGDLTESYPAFAWMTCKKGIDLQMLLREHNILARSGKQFGCGVEYARVSMIGREEEFETFLRRLSTIMEVVIYDESR